MHWPRLANIAAGDDNMGRSAEQQSDRPDAANRQYAIFSACRDRNDTF